ncbi:MAG: TonB-dependent receptor [Candidatus Marinimicrobia bacterium]|nr:TonB-dependent receptor [Candidatus Neomarinimicrobiota bacterium]MCF7923142.1 TonB-dependent receptor [Candidatus Neomarinimicrobiota bacterium]
MTCVKTIFKAVILLAALSLAFGGQKGKISGTIRDAQNLEPLIGVNIIVDELGVGASTDMDGQYYILNLPPGTYTIRFMMIGYAPIISEEVGVAMDQTTTINHMMTYQVLGGDEIRVTATRPVVVKDLSASQVYIKEEAIDEIPVDNVASLVGLQAGAEGVSIRGGGSTQTAFIVDGFQLNDGRSNMPTLSLSLSSVKEVQIQSGGFNAEYGNIRSGIINVITAEGNQSGMNGTFSYYYSPPAPKNFGISPYDPDSYYLRPYLDDDVAWMGTSGEKYEDLNSNQEWDPNEPFEDFNGDGTWTGWDSYTKAQYTDFEGWNARSLITLLDNDPSNDLTPAAAQREFLWKHRREGFITKPDYTLDFGFGGAVPGMESMGNTRYYLSHRSQQTTFVVPLSRDAYTSNTTRLKLNSDISKNMKLTSTLAYSEDRSASTYAWTTTPTGDMVSSTYSVASLVKGGNDILFMPDYYSPADIYRTNLGLKFNHMLDESSFYEVVYQYMRNKYSTFQTEARSDSLYEIAPGLWRDEAPYGYNGGEWMNLGRDNSLIQNHSIKIDYTQQVNDRNQIKTGFAFNYANLQIRSFTDSDKDTWRREQTYDRPPYSLALYIQDKLEYEGFIANVGLRGELNNPNAPIYELDPYDQTYSQGYGTDLEQTAEKSDAKGIWTLSPRLGVSHPISANSKLYFNYGHFHSEPASSYRFRLQRESNGQVTSIGNPNLELERTIAYELGYSHSLYDKYLLNVATYYKDVSKQPGWITYTNVGGSVNYIIPENNNYEDIRGVEFTLSKLEGKWLTGFVNYTYMVQTSGYFGLSHYYQDPIEQRDYEKINPVESRAVPTPYARMSVVFHTPEKYGPNLAGFRPLEDWNLNFLTSYRSGSTWNWTESNRTRYRPWVDTYNINSRLSRTFKTGMGDLEFFMDVSNVLNSKWLSYSGFAGTRDWESYRASLHLPWEEGTEQGDDELGVYRSWDTEYRPIFSVDSIGIVQGTPQSHEIYWDKSDGSYRKWDDSTNDWDATPVSQSDIDKLIEDKAYIDMPNIRSMSFLNPRQITLGVRIKF